MEHRFQVTDIIVDDEIHYSLMLVSLVCLKMKTITHAAQLYYCRSIAIKTTVNRFEKRATCMHVQKRIHACSCIEC